MTPHAFETSSVQVEGSRGSLQKMKVITVQAPYFIVSCLICRIPAVEFPDNMGIFPDTQVKINEFSVDVRKDRLFGIYMEKNWTTP